MPRSELKTEGVDMARDLDYLRKSAEKVKRSIFAIRWEQAQEGHWDIYTGFGWMRKLDDEFSNDEKPQ